MDMKKIYETDIYLEKYKDKIDGRCGRIRRKFEQIAVSGSLSAGINNHLYYGMHLKEGGKVVFREWAPNASRIYLTGEFNNWKKTPAYQLSPVGNGNWELEIDSMFINEGDLYKLYIEWPGGAGERLPAYSSRVIQDPETKLFSAVFSCDDGFKWMHPRPKKCTNPLIYECHIGMSGEKEGIADFNYFRENVLPKIYDLGYNTIQIMALQEHPYYGSFGYQVSNFFALSSRFGTPADFKRLVDEAHGLGISVVMDIVHSHSVDNILEGLSKFDGREDLYFHSGERGRHPAWGSRCFDYGKDEVLYFLLSNCKYWLETYNLDGFRFDGVTSMIYKNHGLGKDFSGYDDYFDDGVDEDAITYLGLANMLIHELRKEAVTIAEDMSGMPGLAAPFCKGGIGFDYRMAMGVPDHWIKWIKEKRDDDWDMGEIWWELTNKREDEQTISYAECHDQALVGDKTLIFRLIDKEMYSSMNLESNSLIVDRGIALHKMIRLLTLATAGNGYLNFMGNEFGHPEWIDFPREGNGWSYFHARRQWSLAEPDYLRYRYLRNFDKAMITLAKTEDFFSEKPVLLTADIEKKILIFKRKRCIFAFNFNPVESFADYAFSAPDGKYELILDTDERDFNGFSRLSAGNVHFSSGEKSPNGNQAFDCSLRLYLPVRTAQVLLEIKC